jgi:hypothetical protein
VCQIRQVPLYYNIKNIISCDQLYFNDFYNVVCFTIGSGKSSLIANWAKQVEDAEPDTFVFVHFIGSSADSSDYLKLIRR